MVSIDTNVQRTGIFLCSTLKKEMRLPFFFFLLVSELPYLNIFWFLFIGYADTHTHTGTKRRCRVITTDQWKGMKKKRCAGAYLDENP